MDRPEEVVDDLTTYISEFAEFALASGARYAIPFASNSCYLHPETFRFNETGQTPQMVSDYFAAQGITSPELVILLSGDGWSEDSGFEVQDGTWFTERERHLLEYQQAIEPKLRGQAEKEADAELTPADFDIFFGSFSKTIPLPLRRFLGRSPVLYVLKSGDSRHCFEVDIQRGQSKEISAFDDETHPIQIHTSAQLLRECMELGLFSHLAISKRVQYRVRAEQYRRLRLLNLALKDMNPHSRCRRCTV